MAVNDPDLYFRFASFVDKIFKGASPAGRWRCGRIS